MTRLFIVLCAVVLVVGGAGLASAEAVSVPAATQAQDAALPAWLLGAQACGSASPHAAMATAADPSTESVVCCTAADRAACTAECAPLLGKTFCIHGCECFCF